MMAMAKKATAGRRWRSQTFRTLADQNWETEFLLTTFSKVNKKIHFLWIP